IREEMVQLANYEADYQVRVIASGGVAAVPPSKAQLRAVVTDQPFQGALLKDWVKNNLQKDVNRIQVAIKIGIVEGQTTDQIVRRIRGTKSAKYQDGIMNIAR